MPSIVSCGEVNPLGSQLHFNGTPMPHILQPSYRAITLIGGVLGNCILNAEVAIKLHYKMRVIWQKRIVMLV